MSRRTFVLCMVLAWVSFASWLRAAESQKTENLSVTIVAPPRDGIEVGKEMAVSGTASIPSGNFLWVLVHRTQGYKKVWYPQEEGVVNPKTKEWEAHVVFGETQDVGYEFEIAVITVNEKEHARLQAYREKAMETGIWRPITMPPTTSAPLVRYVKKVSH